MKKNSTQSINRSLVTSYDSLKQVGNSKQGKELIKLLEYKNQDLHNFYVQFFRSFTGLFLRKVF